MDYYQKYLKYKSKYLELKTKRVQIGGAFPQEKLPTFITGIETATASSFIPDGVSLGPTFSIVVGYSLQNRDTRGNLTKESFAVLHSIFSSLTADQREKIISHLTSGKSYVFSHAEKTYQISPVYFIQSVKDGKLEEIKITDKVKAKHIEEALGNAEVRAGLGGLAPVSDAKILTKKDIISKKPCKLDMACTNPDCDFMHSTADGKSPAYRARIEKHTAMMAKREVKIRDSRHLRTYLTDLAGDRLVRSGLSALATKVGGKPFNIVVGFTVQEENSDKKLIGVDVKNWNSLFDEISKSDKNLESILTAGKPARRGLKGSQYLFSPLIFIETIGGAGGVSYMQLSDDDFTLVKSKLADNPTRALFGAPVIPVGDKVTVTDTATGFKMTMTKGAVAPPSAPAPVPAPAGASDILSAFTGAFGAILGTTKPADAGAGVSSTPTKPRETVEQLTARLAKEQKDKADAERAGLGPSSVGSWGDLSIGPTPASVLAPAPVHVAKGKTGKQRR